MSNSTTIALIKKIGGGGGGSGGGLPDPSELADGTAAIVVNHQWKMQDGYGYTSDPAFEPITWDGNTEGHTYAEEIDGYKVSDIVFSVNDFNGATIKVMHDGVEETTSFLQAVDMGGLVVVTTDIGMSIVSAIAGEYLPEDGTYFILSESGENYVTSITFPSSVHPFDQALIPSSGIEQFPVVLRYSAEDMAYVSDKSIDEIRLACKPNIIIKGYVVNSSMGSSWLNEISFDPVQESFLYCQTVDKDGTPALGYLYFTYNSETEKWDPTEKYVSFDT